MGCGGSKQQDAAAITAGAPPKVKYGPKKDGQPRDVICHICGRKYTVHSINIHIPQCEKLFQAQQEKLPKSDRKQLPQLPKNIEKMDLEERNRIAMKIYSDCTMEACQFCGRTFLLDRLEVHLPSCARNHGKDWPPKTEAAYPTGPNKAKNTVICHICGRKYTVHSIDIHLPQCEQLWKDRQAKLPKNKRKPVPQMPNKNYKKLPLDKRNAMAQKVYNDVSLEQCKYCGRTFLPDRLEVHIKSCARNHAK